MSGGVRGDRAGVRRVLVLRPRALGDVLQATPALRALKTAWPEATLEVVVDDVLEALLRHNPHVDRLWLLPRRGARRGRRWAGLYAALARRRYDLVLDLHGTPGTALLARLVRSPRRVGFRVRGRGWLYDERVPRDTDRHGRWRLMYAARTNLEMVARCGVQGPGLDDESLVFVNEAQVERRIEAEIDRLAPARPRVGLAATGGSATRSWPLERWARTADQLVAAGCSVLLLWGPGERAAAEALRERMGAPAALVPPTDLLELGAVLARLDLLVGNDSGPKHLAVACGTPTLTLFGPTNPINWNPPLPQHAVARVALPCLGCNLKRCAHHLCMRLLEPDVVAAQALDLLAGRAAGAGRRCAC